MGCRWLFFLLCLDVDNTIAIQEILGGGVMVYELGLYESGSKKDALVIGRDWSPHCLWTTYRRHDGRAKLAPPLRFNLSRPMDSVGGTSESRYSHLHKSPATAYDIPTSYSPRFPSPSSRKQYRYGPVVAHMLGFHSSFPYQDARRIRVRGFSTEGMDGGRAI